MIARVQAIGVVFLLLCAALWLAGVWPHSPGLAVGGLVLGSLLYPGVMALEFALARRLNCLDRLDRRDRLQQRNRSDPVPAVSVWEMVKPWTLEMGAALRVFCWDQPFRSCAEPDWLPSAPTGQRGVVLVHGFMCNRAVWRPWFAPLRAAGHAFEAVNLEPVLGSIDGYAPIIDAAVRRVQAATGMAPVVIGHSMGGLAARAWLRAFAADGRVHRIVTLGTPHHGTWTARFARGGNGRQMALDGEWTLALLAAEPTCRSALFTCWYSNCDNVVFPASTATLPGADNRLVAGVAHVQMARHPRVMAACLAQMQDTADSG